MGVSCTLWDLANLPEPCPITHTSMFSPQCPHVAREQGMGWIDCFTCFVQRYRCGYETVRQPNFAVPAVLRQTLVTRTFPPHVVRAAIPFTTVCKVLGTLSGS